VQAEGPGTGYTATGKPIAITRTEFSASGLRELAARTRDGDVVRQVLAIAIVLEGHSREEAVRLNGTDRQALRDWIAPDTTEVVWRD
jgi:hypothetical protein